MNLETSKKSGALRFLAGLSAVILVSATVPRIYAADADIVWSGDFSTGDFSQWHRRDDPAHPQFAGIPKYGRPVAPNPMTGSASASYYGDGSLLELVTSPVRQGKYAAKVTVKNGKNGTDPDDCDVSGSCTKRRTELWMHSQLYPAYGGFAYGQEWWGSLSVYVPRDWDSKNGSNWGPNVYQIKPIINTSKLSPCFSIEIQNNGWKINHRWNPDEYPDSTGDWHTQMFYDADYPNAAGTDSGRDMRVDFPEQAVSQAALADLNKGGWTDWVFNIRFDGRGAAEGGKGFLSLWKRAGDGPWTKVLHILPKGVTRGGVSFDHGICYKQPGSGFGPISGMYMHSNQALPLPANRVLFIDNVKVGRAGTSFARMSPDGSSPGSAGKPESPPRPPELLTPR